MLSPVEQERLIDLIVTMIAAFFVFAIVSTLSAVIVTNCYPELPSNDSKKTIRNATVRRKCVAWAKKNGKLAS